VTCARETFRMRTEDFRQMDWHINCLKVNYVLSAGVTLYRLLIIINPVATPTACLHH